MNSQYSTKEYASPAVPEGESGLDYHLNGLGGQAQYNQQPTTTTTTSLTVEASQPYNLLYQPPPTLDPNTHYPQDTTGYYSAAASHGYSSIDVRPSFGPSTPFSTGMDHTPRTALLPQPLNHHMSTREQYAHATPSFRRQSEHPTRSSSSYGGAHFRRPQVSTSPSSSAVVSYGTIPGNTDNRMESPSRAGPASEKTRPPLEGPTHFGEMRYQDTAKTACHATINGSIDKFFIADDRWTCYRRNYFSCACSFSLGPYFPGTPVEVKPVGAQSFFMVHEFGVSISAVVAGNEQQVIELVQHTPKRDKGPTSTPSIIPLMAKQDVINLGYFNLEDSNIPARNYPDAWVPSESGGIGTLTEWTFERIQFKQATQNNGKRRAQQQFYHLLVELWVNISPSNTPDWHKIVHRKSAQLIVRGRSPGHYQSERSHSRDGSRNTDNQPAIYGAPMGGPRGYGGGQMHPFGGYDASHGIYDPNQRNHHHHQQQHHHHALPRDTMLPTEDEKPMDGPKHFTYYPGAMDGSYHGHNTTEPWAGHHDQESVSHMIAGVDINSKVKNEYDNITLPRLVHPSSLSNNNDQSRSCRTFDGRPSSNGAYPQLLSPTSMNMSL